MRARRDYYLSGPCSVQSSWPCPYCFYIDVGESWLVEEILPKPQAIEIRRLRAVEAGVDKECVRPLSPHFRLVLLIIVKSPPRKGSGTFLPGDRPPVNVLCKGGRSPKEPAFACSHPMLAVEPHPAARIYEHQRFGSAWAGSWCQLRSAAAKPLARTYSGTTSIVGPGSMTSRLDCLTPRLSRTGPSSVVLVGATSKLTTHITSSRERLVDRYRFPDKSFCSKGFVSADNADLPSRSRRNPYHQH